MSQRTTEFRTSECSPVRLRIVACCCGWPCCGSISFSLHVALPHSLQQPPHLIGLGTLQTIESSDVSHVDEAQAALPLICCREPSRSLIVRLLSAAALIVPIGTGVLYYWAILSGGERCSRSARMRGWWQSKAERPGPELPPFHELLRLRLQLQQCDRDCAAETISTPTAPGEAC